MKNRKFLAAAHRAEDLPGSGLPVVAFGGRSNVGKSSLLNVLSASQVARVSRTPGRTRGIYFYDSGQGWIAADLPGYGFARASREEREQWRRLAEAFFEGSGPSLTVQLIDPRIPVSDFDLEFRDYLRDLGLPNIFVATKADRMSRSERSRAARRLEPEFGTIRFVSARTGEGIEDLKQRLSRWLAERGPEQRTRHAKTN
jgi:GTP-binding protein